MARTPIFAAFRRLVQQMRHANGRQGNIPASDESVPITRREMLKLGLMAAATPAWGSCDAAEEAGDSGQRVVIVGGGLAGLHCAHRLREAGIRATVYEGSSRVGGRVFTDRQTFSEGLPGGQHCELGGELINSDHETMLSLAEEFGLALLDYTTDTPELEQLVAHFGGQRLNEAEILEGFAPIASAIDAALGSLLDQDDPYVYYDKPNGGESLDALSISQWLDQIGASGPVRDLLEVAYTAEYGLDASEQNALNLMFLISTDTETFEVLGDSDERFHVAEGNDAIVRGMADALDPSQIELNAQLLSVREKGTRVVLTFRRDETTFEVVADHVVLAIPFTILRDVELAIPLSNTKRKAIEELGMGTNAKLMCGFKERVWRQGEKASNGSSYTDLGYQASWETSRLQAGAEGIITNFTGGSAGVALGDGTPEAQMASFLQGFDAVFPGAEAASNGRVARFHWPSYSWTRGSYACYRPGQFTAFAGVEAESVGPVHFAGEHTNLDYQGYMEGAALSGAIAADVVLEAVSPQGVDALGGALRWASSPASWRIWRRARAARMRRRLRRLAAIGQPGSASL